jgi:hypothetical protein
MATTTTDKATKAKPAKAPAKAKAKTSPDKATKTSQVIDMLLRKEGCTRKDILSATNWTSVSVQAVCATAGLKLRTEQKEGERLLRYYGSKGGK